MVGLTLNDTAETTNWRPVSPLPTASFSLRLSFRLDSAPAGPGRPPARHNRPRPTKIARSPSRSFQRPPVKPNASPSPKAPVGRALLPDIRYILLYRRNSPAAVTITG